MLRRTLGILISLAAIGGFVVLAWLTGLRLQTAPRTDDGYLDADIVNMAPDVSGRIVRLDVQNNRLIHRGDELFAIDPEPYRYRVAQAQAELDGLQAQLATDVSQVASQNSKADAASSSVLSASAQLALANSTLHRLLPLGARGFVPAEQIDQARAAQRTAAATLESAVQQARGARQQVTNTKPLEAQVESARATLALAQRDLRLTVVRAPCDGQITALDTATGEFATTGKPVFTIIDTERWYAVGNFRETNLAGLAPGQAADIYLLGEGGRRLDGHVDSLGGGVVPDEGSDLGGLPRVPRSLEWVRIAQRFPVRILIDHPPAGSMRIGATVSVVIHR